MLHFCSRHENQLEVNRIYIYRISYPKVWFLEASLHHSCLDFRINPLHIYSAGELTQ